VVDKTGTLTEGKPRVTAIVAAEGFDEATVILLGASLEQSSEHPLAAPFSQRPRNASWLFKRSRISRPLRARA